MAENERKPAPPLGDEEFLEISMDPYKGSVNLVIWAGIFALMAFVFIFQYGSINQDTQGSGFAGRFGDELFLVIGLFVCGFILWYILVVVNQVFFKGPLYRISKEGLWLNQAGKFFIPRKAIFAVFFTYNHGLTTHVVLELSDRNLLKDMETQLPRFAGTTCNPEEGSLSLALTGLKEKKLFIRALSRLSPRLI